MITVMGATGNTGREITRLLRDAGEPVRVMGRSRERLAPLEAAGAEPVVGDAADPAHLATAFRGADAVFTMSPYDPSALDYLAEQERTDRAVVEALRVARVGHVVALSSLGADLPAGNGFVASLYAQEQRLRTLDAAVLVLRPGSYYENFAAALDTIRDFGEHADSVDPDAPVPMIATRDVAAAAAAALRARDWTGTVVRELLGPRDLSNAEATRILGAALGLPDLSYVQLPAEEMIVTLRRAGFSESAAALHVELGRAVADGTIVSLQGRTPLTTTPTRFEDYAADLARAQARLIP
jgi:uncharacterized protein YbjT (DUF2867 family)